MSRKRVSLKDVVPDVLRDLHGMADSNCTLNFFRAFFHGVFELHVIRIDVIDSCRFTCVVELRLFKSPMPLLI